MLRTRRGKERGKFVGQFLKLLHLLGLAYFFNILKMGVMGILNADLFVADS